MLFLTSNHRPVQFLCLAASRKSKRRVAAKSSNQSLDEILVEADEFVNEMKKAGKKQKKKVALFNFSRSYNGQTGK